MCLVLCPIITIPEAHFTNHFFHRNSNVMEISFCSLSSHSKVIAMKFITWHDSSTVMPCVKFCSVMISYNGVTLKPIFPLIWITMEESFVKWAAVQQGVNLCKLMTPWTLQMVLCASHTIINEISNLIEIGYMYHFFQISHHNEI